MHDSFIWMFDIWGFMDIQGRINFRIASLCQCERQIQHRRSFIPPGLVQGYAMHWRRPKAVSPSPNSRGLTDRLNDTAGVTACLRLIFEYDWSSQWVAFHQCWADKRDLFHVVFVRVCSLCLHMYACSSKGMHKRRKALWLLSGLCWNLTFLEMMSFVWTRLQCAIPLFIAWHIYTIMFSRRLQNRILCLGQCVIKPCWLCLVLTFTKAYHLHKQNAKWTMSAPCWSGLCIK